MPTHAVPVAILSLLLLPVPTAIGQVPAEPEKDLRTMVAKLMRENDRLRSAIQSCVADRDAARGAPAEAEASAAEAPGPAAGGTHSPPAHLALAADARFAAVESVAGTADPAPATNALRDSPPPDRNAQYVVGDDKADGAVSPIPFPQVPQRTDRFSQHLARQLDILQRQYTPGALQGLPQDEAQCNDSRTRLYCQMAVRLYWIGSAR
jgi:hypothetical protein